MTADEVLTFAKGKYQMYIEEGTWNTHMKHSDEILAMQAKIQDLNTKLHAKAPKNKGDGSKKEKAKNKKSKKKGEAKSGYADWQFKAPATGKPTSKNVDGKEYHWCTKEHGKDKVPMWARHKPADHGNQANTTVTSTTATPAAAVAPQANLEAALTSFIDK